MKKHFFFIAALLAVASIGGGWPTCKCPGPGGFGGNGELLLRVRRWEVVTNVAEHFIIGRSDTVMMTNYITNAIIGTAHKELFRAEAMR